MKMDSEIWNKKYILSVFKGMVLNLLAVFFFTISYLLYYYIITGEIYTHLRRINNVFFYYISIGLFLIFTAYYIHKAKTEEF